MSEARYAVGIDLGTTHCALSYVDLQSEESDTVTQELFALAQRERGGSGV